jgi:hypothetical protein
LQIDHVEAIVRKTLWAADLRSRLCLWQALRDLIESSKLLRMCAA